MENQQIFNAIAALASTIDPLLRADKKEEISVIVKKIMELAESIK